MRLVPESACGRWCDGTTQAERAQTVGGFEGARRAGAYRPEGRLVWRSRHAVGRETTFSPNRLDVSQKRWSGNGTGITMIGVVSLGLRLGTKRVGEWGRSVVEIDRAG